LPIPSRYSFIQLSYSDKWISSGSGIDDVIIDDMIVLIPGHKQDFPNKNSLSSSTQIT